MNIYVSADFDLGIVRYLDFQLRFFLYSTYFMKLCKKLKF